MRYRRWMIVSTISVNFRILRCKAHSVYFFKAAVFPEYIYSIIFSSCGKWMKLIWNIYSVAAGDGISNELYVSITFIYGETNGSYISLISLISLTACTILIKLFSVSSFPRVFRPQSGLIQRFCAGILTSI